MDGARCDGMCNDSVCCSCRDRVDTAEHATIHRVDSIPTLIELYSSARTHGLVRGDMIVCKFDGNYGYRACGLYFFDGRKIIPHCTEYDDYGSVPKKFGIITEFPPGYWDLWNVSPANYRDYKMIDESLHVTTPTIIKDCIYWHDPSNCGSSPIVINRESIIAGIDDWGHQNTLPAKIRIIKRGENGVIIITLFENSNLLHSKYAIITSISCEEVQARLSKESVWWVTTYPEGDATLEGVESKNILFAY